MMHTTTITLHPKFQIDLASQGIIVLDRGEILAGPDVLASTCLISPMWSNPNR